MVVMDSRKINIPEPLTGNDVGSFAYQTIKDRLPVIITKTIDFLHRSRKEITKNMGNHDYEELVSVIGKLAKLRNEMQTDKQFVELNDDYIDTKLWNEALKDVMNKKKSQSWFGAPWLFSECFMYRRIFEAFQLTTNLKLYDPFQHQKKESLLLHMDRIEEILINFDHRLKETSHIEDLKHNFMYFVELSLWGNKCDLSLSAGVQNSSLKPTSFNDLQSFILVNDKDLVWEKLICAKESGGISLDIVLDNAGFELCTDLCLIEFLTHTGLVKKARFHVKDMPWFVSDTTKSDFLWTIDTLKAKNDSFTSKFGRAVCSRIESKQWEIVNSVFWTLPYSYSQMEKFDRDLYTDLSKADLVIFKGDLNYRKLFGDLKWSHNVPVKAALQGFQPSALCSLRTLKADIVVGLKEGQAENVEKIDDKWMVNGNYAVIQYSD